MSSTRWTLREALRLRRLVRSGMTQEQAGKQYGVSRQRVNQVLKEHNLIRRPRG